MPAPPVVIGRLVVGIQGCDPFLEVPRSFLMLDALVICRFGSALESLLT